MTNDYLNEFTPDWPHGHVIVFNDGSTVLPFVVKVTDAPGNCPIWGHVVGEDHPWLFRAGGDYGYGDLHLRNAAPPQEKPKPTAREWWVMVDSCDGASLKIFDDKITALDNASRLRNVTVIRVREVLDGEDTK